MRQTLKLFIFVGFFLMLARANAGDIPKDFKPWVDKFTAEAKKRKVNLNKGLLSVLKMKFGFDLMDYNTLAQCDSKNIQIQVSESYWVTSADAEKEILIFHELGHCILGRGHDDGTMPISGGKIFKSIMNSSGNALVYRFPNYNNCASNADDCGQSLVFAPKSGNNFYNRFRKIYLDELFKFETDPQTAADNYTANPIIDSHGKPIPFDELIPDDEFVSDKDDVTDPVVRVKLGKRCDRGDKEGSCNILGNVEQKLGHLSIAKSLYLKACNLANMIGCDNLGLMESNAGDTKSSLLHFKKACDNGGASGCAHLSLSEINDGNLRDAKKYAKTACDGKYMVGCFALGIAEFKDNNSTQAKIHLKMACDDGIKQSCDYIGNLAVAQFADPQVSEHYFYIVPYGEKLKTEYQNPSQKVVKNSQNFGVYAKFSTQKKKLHVVVQLDVPSKPENFGCKKCGAGELTIADDKHSVVVSKEIEGKDGKFIFNWGIDGHDPRGQYNIKLTIDGITVDSYSFTVE